MSELLRRISRIVGLRGGLARRMAIGVASALVGAVVFGAITQFIDACHAFAAFYPVVQIAGLAGGVAAAATSALVAVAIVLFAAEPVFQLAAGAILLFASAALAGFAGERLRASGASEPRGGEAKSFEAIAASITHDISQPLAAAAAYLQTVRRLLPTEPDERNMSSAAVAVDKAAMQLVRAGRLVSRLREFLSHGAPRLASVSLHELIIEAIGPHRDDGPRLGLEARDDMVAADAMQIEKLFAEVLQAAAPVAAITTRSDARHVTVTVALGGGDLDAAGARAGDVALWRAVAEAHGGEMRIDRASQNGPAAIALTLPLAVAGE